MTQAASSLKIRLAIATLIRENLDDLMHPDSLNSFRELIDAAQATTYPHYGTGAALIGGTLAQEPSPAADKPAEKTTTKKSTAGSASSDPGATQEKPAPKDAAPVADGKAISTEDKQKMPEYQAIKKLVLELSKLDRPKAAAIIAPAEKLVDVPVERFAEVQEAFEAALRTFKASAADLA